MNKSLLFLNVLSGQINPATYVKEQVQALIANRLALPLHKVQMCWLDVDKEQLQAASAPVTAQRTLQELFGRTTWMQDIPPQRWHVVMIVPAYGDMNALIALSTEATRMTDGQDAAVIVLYQEYEEMPKLFHVIPEPERDAAFGEALAQTRDE